MANKASCMAPTRFKSVLWAKQSQKFNYCSPACIACSRWLQLYRWWSPKSSPAATPYIYIIVSHARKNKPCETRSIDALMDIFIICHACSNNMNKSKHCPKWYQILCSMRWGCARCDVQCHLSASHTILTHSNFVLFDNAITRGRQQLQVVYIRVLLHFCHKYQFFASSVDAQSRTKAKKHRTCASAHGARRCPQVLLNQNHCIPDRVKPGHVVSRAHGKWQPMPTRYFNWHVFWRNVMDLELKLHGWTKLLSYWYYIIQHAPWSHTHFEGPSGIHWIHFLTHDFIDIMSSIQISTAHMTWRRNAVSAFPLLRSMVHWECVANTGKHQQGQRASHPSCLPA